jgi:hypothetical protein
MGKIIIQNNFYDHKESINEEKNYLTTMNHLISKSSRFYKSFYNVVNLPINPSVKRSRPSVPWKPSQESLAQWKAKSTMGPVAKNLQRVDKTDNNYIPQQNVGYSYGEGGSVPGIADKKISIKGIKSDFVLPGKSTEYTETNQLIKDENYRPSGIKIDTEGLPVPDHRDKNYSKRLEFYILNTLIPKVNQHGEAPFWLRPLAAVAAWLGYHGVGQTNCLSCAASVADTLKEGVLHQAFSTLSDISPSKFSTLQNPLKTYEEELIDSIEDLASYLNNSPVNLNIVLTIKRPSSFWRRLFSAVDGHACNIIRTGSDLHLVDAQKRRYKLVNMTSANRLSEDLITVLQEFIGAVSPEKRSLVPYNVGWMIKKGK